MTARLPAPTERSVPGAHGLTLRLRDWPGPGPPVLFLHGFLLDSHSWDFVIPRLLPTRRVLALDGRGHGRSAVDPEFRYHHVALGLDAREVLDGLGLSPVDVVAHSTSGHAAIGLAARHPELVHRLVLVEAGPELPERGRGGARDVGAAPDPRYPDVESYAAVLARRHPHARAEILMHIARHGLREGPTGALEPAYDERFTRPRTAADPEERRRFDRAAWAREGERRLWEDLARVRCPTLVARGALSSRLSSGTVERMTAEYLTDGSSVVIEGAGHNVMLDRPEALADAIAMFLGDRSATSPG